MAVDLGKQVGPLPLGAWFVVVGAGLGLAYYGYHTQSAPSAVTPDENPGVGDGSAGGSFIPLTPTQPDPTTTNTAPTTNEEWGKRCIDWLIGQGYPADVSDSAIRKYLAGNDPKPSVQEFTLQRIALQHFGSPPTPLPPAVNDPPSSVPPPTGTPPPVTKPPTTTPPPTTKHFVYYTVKAWPAKGSTLSGIAEIEYGHAGQWPDIYNANRKGKTRADGKPGMISNPNLLFAGWSLLIPGK